MRHNVRATARALFLFLFCSLVNCKEIDIATTQNLLKRSVDVRFNL